jgi:hypothetical protein
LADVNANIDVNLNTQEALANLRNLQAGLSRFNQSLTQGNVAAMDAQKGLNQQLIQSINATGKFVASQRNVSSSTGAFTEALEKNKLSMREYFRFTAAAATANTKSLKGVFAQERDIINRARRDRVKALQTQYVQLTNANGDLVKVLQVVPKHLQMVNGKYTDYATRVQMAAQRQQFLNQLLKQGSTQLLNFGKNTQWAGRQLMVGLTVPLTMLGSYASKAFMEMEKALIKFTRVYGDMTTSMGDTDAAVKQIQTLAKEFTKYGIAVVDTVTMAADAAAMGLTGSALTAQVTAATRLAVLGQVEQQQALETTISLQNAFGISSEELAHKINFLNAVENQTVLSIEDLTTAIPKAGPVVKQLGGSVEDLAFFMTAMKEGGINASEGANALKSGLASMINPAKKTSEFLAGLGINIKGIVDNNAGNLKGTVVGLAQALDTLDPLNRARAIEQLFGKFQFSRLSTLFQNVTKDSSQASRALGLAGASVEELAILSERELGKVEDSVGIKFKKSLEDLKLQLVPVGKAFLQAVTPIVKFAGKILEKFNNLGDGTKRVITTIIGVLGLVAPAALMTFGLVANGVANLIKLFAMMRNGIAKLNGQNNILGGGFDYLTQAETENLAQSNALHLTHKDLIDTFNVEAGAVNALALAYTNAASQARTLASSAPGLFNTVPGPAGAVSGLPKVKKYAEGIVSVPGTGNKDTVPAMLTPGEAVVPAGIAQSPTGKAMLSALMNDNVRKYNGGTLGVNTKQTAEELVRLNREDFVAAVSAMGPNPRSQAAIAKELTEELTKAAERVGPEFADRLKSAIAQGLAELETVTAKAIENLTKQTDSVTQRPFREQYHAASATRFEDENYVFGHGAAPKAEVTDPQELLRLSTQAQRVAADGTRTDTGLSTSLRSAAENGGRAYGLSSFGFMLPEAANKRDEGGNFEMPKDQIAALFSGPNAGKTLSPIYQEWARIQGTTLEEVLKDPAQFARMQQSMESYGGILSDEISRLPENFGEEEFYGAVARANDRIAAADTQLSQAVDNLLKTTTYAVFDPNDGRGGQGNRVAVPKKSDVPLRQELGLQDEVEVNGKKIKSLQGTYQKQNTANLTVGSTIDKARADGAALGAAVIDGLRGSDGTAASSPSRKGIKAGKEVAEGLALGMQEGTPEVISQSSQLGDAAVPKRRRSAAETQARVDKMDLDNKSFYDDLNTPEFLEQRQILKSQDRQRRKRGATGRVGGGPSTPPVTPPSSGPSSLTVSSTARTEAAAEDLAVSTEQAATAQSQVVQQIHDESKSRITIKGNTINIGKARQEADRLDKEASDAEAAAAKVRTEAAKWEEVAAREGGKNMHTSENAKALKKLADEAEIKAAEARLKAAEAEQLAAELEGGSDATEQTVKDPAKVKKAEELISSGTQEQGDGLRRIVEGTNDTADSTTLVADKTDDLVDATSETVDAQTTHADNVVTSSELANATSNNLENVVNATQQTGISQEEIANSSEEISETNNKLSKEKREALRLEEEANRKKKTELGQPPLNGPVPPGSQAGNKIPSTYVDIDEALAEAYGTDTTQGFTQNKKGQIILDPETGQPTTLDEKQILKKKRGMRREKASKFSGKAAGALGMATMVAGAVGAPPAVTGALGTAAGVAQMAPMLAGMGPVGWAVAGIAAVGVGLYALNKRLQASYAAQAKFVRETSASTQKMKEIGMITGKVGASELMARKRAGGTTRDYIARERKGSDFGDTFMQSDTGKNMAKTLQANVEKSGAKEAAETFATEIAAYVQDGVLTAAQAQDIAYQIGVNFKDTSLGIKIDANLAALIGPNGEDLTKDPLIVAMRLNTSAQGKSEKYLADMENAKYNGNSGAVEASGLAASDAVAVQTAQMQADAIAKRYDDEIRTLQAQIAQTANKKQQVKLEGELTALKQKANDAEFQMNNLVANATDNAMKRFTENIQYQNTALDAVTLGLYKLWGSPNQREAAYMQGLSGAVTDKYANTEQATQAQAVQDRLAKYSDGGAFLGLGKDDYTEAGFKSGMEAQQFEVKMKLLMANGTLTPNQETAMLDLFEGNLPQLETVLDIGTRMHGAAGTAEFMMLLTNFQDKEYAQQIALEVTTHDNDSFKKLSDLFGLASWLDGKEIVMEVVVKEMGGVAGMQYYIDRLDELGVKIKNLKGGEVTLDVVTQFTNDTSVKVDQGFLDYINKEFKGDAEKQTNAIRTYTMVYNQIMSMDYASQEARDYFEAQANQIAVDKLNELRKAGNTPVDINAYIVQQTQLEIDALITKVRVDPTAVASAKTQIALGTLPVIDPNAGGPVKTPTGGKADNPLDFLDALGMRIKMIRDQSFKATKSIESMLAAFRSKAAQKDVSNMFTLFDGLQQRLIALKAPKEFRDYIAGLDAKGLEALKNKDADPTKKGNQSMFTYETKKVKGKTVVNKNKIAGFSEAGKAFMAAYNEAPLAEFNVEQAEAIQNTNNQYKAFAMLKAGGVDTAKALDAVSNAAVAAALTSGLLAKTDLKRYIEDIKTSNDALQKQAVINDLLAKNSAMEFAEKSMPELASAMKASGYSAEQIAKVLEDPNLAKQLIEDLKDGKVDSKAISDYLNNIKKEKFVEIKGKFNAGDFAAAAAPGMELVNRMFAVQEQLIRTGVDARSTAMVNRLKSNKDANEKAQLDIQNITFKQIVPIQKTIEAAQRKMEVEIIRVIEAYQEEISDMQRVIELAFERPIQKINEQNAQLTHDLDVMNHAAEQINKSYDDQATALSKVAEVNAQIVNQQKQQLGLADALSQGDIAAAARAAQEMRASQADRNAENASKALEQSRQNELNNLRGEKSGLTREQITEKQYQNSQKIYDLENNAKATVTLADGTKKDLTRLQILEAIQVKSDQIYDLEEKREAAQLAIRAEEDKIYNINKKQIEPIQDGIDARNNQIANDEYAMQQLVNNIQVQGQTRDHWDRVTAKIEASSVAAQDFDHLMGSMLASVEKIDQGWEKINETIGLNAKGVTEGAKAVKDAMLKESAGYEQAQAVKIANAKIAEAAAQKEYETKMAAYDAEVVRIKKLQSLGMPSQVANQMIANVVKPKAPVVGPTEAADNPNVSYNDTSKNTADQYRKDNLKGVKPSTSNGTSSGGGGGGNGGGGGDQNTKPVWKPATYTKDSKKPVLADYTKKYGADEGKRTYYADAAAWSKATGKSSGIKFTPATYTKNSKKPVMEDYEKYDVDRNKNYYVDHAAWEKATTGKETPRITAGKDPANAGEDPRNYSMKKPLGSYQNPWQLIANKSLSKEEQETKMLVFDHPDNLNDPNDYVTNGILNKYGLHMIGTQMIISRNKDKNQDGTHVRYGNYIYKLISGRLNKLASGGMVMQNIPSFGTDTVPAILSPGEFVMSKYAVNAHGADNMRAINNGTAIGESVYNYNLSVNVKSDANPDDIARVVMAQIRGIDSQRVKGNKF